MGTLHPEMLKSDRIELSILTLVVGSAEGRRSFSVQELANAVSESLGPASNAEIVEVLLLLYESHFLALGKYVNSTFTLYEPEEGLDYFYAGTFQCRALPRARRRQQELARGNREGIFISHIADEKEIAFRLQRLFLESLSPPVPVFVSSDYYSIESGDKWYEAILAGLRRAEVIVILLSKASIDRRWINFEAGIGMGQESRVIPVTWRGLTKDEIGLPLGQLQARDLHSKLDMKALLDTIAKVCHCRVDDALLPPFLNDIVALEPHIPQHDLEVAVFRRGGQICLAVRNSGNRPLDMIDAELLIPTEFCQNMGWFPYQPVRDLLRLQHEGVSLIGYRLTTHPSSQPHLGIESLRSVLVKEIGELVLTGLSLPMPDEMVGARKALLVRYRVSSRQMTVGPAVVRVGDIPYR
jgi:hypothetical protein